MKNKLNILPQNPEQSAKDAAVGLGRFPPWLHRPLPQGHQLWTTDHTVKNQRLPTVCEEAKCPNRVECWSEGTATFLALGKECTRNCGFCSIDYTKSPKPPEDDEPARIAESVKQLNLKHAVITMVARDDLTDGGAFQIASIIQAIREKNPGTTIEVLVSDLQGNPDALDVVLKAKPEIFNHNIETVRSLTPRVRHQATYERTLKVLKYAKASGQCLFIKSGLMVGLGETEREVFDTLKDLYEAGCQIVTIGQYLQASRLKLRVKDFITPSQFETYAEYGRNLGITHMYCGPFVRSSYNAGLVFNEARRI